jgi:acyl carrier protein
MSVELDLQLRRVFASIFPVDPSAIEDGARRGELDGWDSLAHLDLVSELENEFGVTLDPEEALEIETFGDAKRVVAQRLRGG